MAYDEGLAQRIRETLEETSGITEKKMFGGLSFMLHGNLACGVIKDDLIVRVGPDNDTEALKNLNVRPFDFSGRAMKGWVMVSAEGYRSDRELKDWIQLGVDFTDSLPPK